MLSEDRLAFVLSLDLYSLDFINIPATLHYGNLETQPTIIICEKIISDYEKLGEIFRNNNSQIYFYFKKNSAHNGKDLIINPDNLSVTLWILMDKRKNSLFITFVILVNICGKCSEYPTHFTSTLMKCHIVTDLESNVRKTANISYIGLRLHFSCLSPCATGVATKLGLSIDVEPVAGVRDPAGPVHGGVLGELHDAFVPQLAHVHLEQSRIIETIRQDRTK